MGIHPLGMALLSGYPSTGHGYAEWLSIHWAWLELGRFPCGYSHLTLLFIDCDNKAVLSLNILIILVLKTYLISLSEYGL